MQVAGYLYVRGLVVDETPPIWYTNREVVEVRGTARFATWLRERQFEHLAASCVATPGFFLVPSPSSKVGGTETAFEPEGVRENLTESWFRKVFESELAELGLPAYAWPDTSNLELFRSFFSVTHHPLIADFGTEPLNTRKVSG